MKRTKVRQNDIVETFDACPYCYKAKAETWHACCHEVHTERAYTLTNGDTLLESEIEIDTMPTLNIRF
jgi:hypothetical protein